MKRNQYFAWFLLLVAVAGCGGGNITGSAAVNDGSGSPSTDPDAGVATDQDDMMKGMTK